MIDDKPGVPVSKSIVSVIIPTLNEGLHLPICLESLKSQTIKGFELIVVDSGSRDGTREVAASEGAIIVDYPGRLLGARYEGLKISKGELILNLDADQVLYPDTLERAVTAILGLDMLALEEFSYQPKGFLQNSISRQKAALQQSARPGELPLHCYPRVFRRKLLEDAFSQLPQDALGSIFLNEDRILFSKTRGISNKVGFLPRGVMHIEEDTWLGMLRHSYRTGKSKRSLRTYNITTEANPPESSIVLLRRAVRNRYFIYSLLKELATRLGVALG